MRCPPGVGSRQRYSDEHHGFLREADAGQPLEEAGRKHGFSEATYYARKAKFGGMNVPDTQRLKARRSSRT